MSTGILGSPDLLLSYPITTVSLHISIILTMALMSLIFLHLYIYNYTIHSAQYNSIIQLYDTGTVYDLFVKNRQQLAYLDALEPYIFTGLIETLPTRILHDLLDIFTKNQRVSSLERCVVSDVTQIF